MKSFRWEGDMKRNTIFEHEEKRSYGGEAVVASLWTTVFVVFVAASLLGGQSKSKLIETADVLFSLEGLR
jgi:hypothetical protein